MKKNAAKAKIGKHPGKAPTKETVETPFSECTAENPLECRFHGVKALEQMLGPMLKQTGYSGPYKVEKIQDAKGYEFYIPANGFVLEHSFEDSLNDSFKKSGYGCAYETTIEEEDGIYHVFYVAKGKGSPKPADGEGAAKEKDDVDLVEEGIDPDLEDGELDLEDIDLDSLDNEETVSLVEEGMKNGAAKVAELSGNDGNEDKDKPPTFEQMKDFLLKGGVLVDADHIDESTWSPIVQTGRFKSGDPVGDVWKTPFKKAVEKLPDHPVTKFVKSWLDKDGANEKLPPPPEEIPLADDGGEIDPNSIDLDALNNDETDSLVEEGMKNKGGDAKDGKVDDTPSKEKEPTEKDWDEAIKIIKGSAAFLNSYDFSTFLDDEHLKKSIKSALWKSDVVEADPLCGTNQKAYKYFIEAVAAKQGKDSPIVKAMVGAYMSHPDYDMEGLAKYTPGKPPSESPSTKATKPSESPKPSEPKDAIKSPEPEDAITAQKPLSVELDESLMKPLEHDEAKFPQKLTQKALDAAIAKGKKAGGHGGLHTSIVTIGDKKYICKYGAGKKSNIIKNGYNADMAYRAAGVYAPDAKLYEFGDGKTYKLAEFIEGKRLIDVWKGADEAKREEIRKELLKGYPLDALFSNYDVLGTSPEESRTVTITGPDGRPQKTHVAFDNVIIGDDGHAYRIDNDGAFAMTGTGGHKTSSGGAYTTKVAAEKWEDWKDRKWIDDFRTMRRNERNLGIFDRYSTADIFLAAGNINFDKAVESLPEPLQKALEKPLFEMKQMTYRAVNIALGGFRNDSFVSMALDASYDASKKGLREQCKLAVAWNNPGFGKYKAYWGNYQPQPFDEKPPEPPEDPTKVLNDKLKNEAYTGGLIGEIIFKAAKTINYHGGEKKFDEHGNQIGQPMTTPDFDPNAKKIADWEKIDREKLAELAKTDENAKTLLGLYDTIAYSKENGWKKPIGIVPANLVIEGKLDPDFKSKTEKKILKDQAGAIKEFKAKQKKYRQDLLDYEKRKSEHKKKEEAKALAAGGSPYHNFHHFAQAFMEEGYNTDGIAHTVQTNGIKPIESSMEAQKGASYYDDAVKWKVRGMMALGYSPEEIIKMADEGKLYKGSYYTDCINHYLIPNRADWDRDMNSQAMYMGLNMLKMENELSDLYDKASGVVYLNRNINSTPKGLTAAEKEIYDSHNKTGWVGPHIDSAADCMQFEKNSWGEPKKQVYAVPFSRIVCCANNEKASGDHFGYHGEQEYVGNLYQLPCWVYHYDNNLTWKGAIDQAKQSAGMSDMLKGYAQRLAAFNTLET